MKWTPRVPPRDTRPDPYTTPNRPCTAGPRSPSRRVFGVYGCVWRGDATRRFAVYTSSAAEPAEFGVPPPRARLLPLPLLAAAAVAGAASVKARLLVTLSRAFPR